MIEQILFVYKGLMTLFYGVKIMLMTKTHWIFVLIVLWTSMSHAQSGIKWYTWEEGMVKSESEHKKFVIDMYTDWCGWCKKMDRTTFSDPRIIDYINTNYIPIKFDAEHKENITFKGEEHRFVRSGRRGYHTLAAKLTNGRLSYPTIVFLDESKELIQAIPGFQDATMFNPILIYFAEDLHKKMPWNSFLRNYNNANRQMQGNSILVGQEKGN